MSWCFVYVHIDLFAYIPLCMSVCSCARVCMRARVCMLLVGAENCLFDWLFVAWMVASWDGWMICRRLNLQNRGGSITNTNDLTSIDTICNIDTAQFATRSYATVCSWNKRSASHEKSPTEAASTFWSVFGCQFVQLWPVGRWHRGPEWSWFKNKMVPVFLLIFRSQALEPKWRHFAQVNIADIFMLSSKLSKQKEIT